MSEPSLSSESVGTLYREHHGWLQSWLRLKLGNATDAADLAQDAFVRLMAARRQADLGPQPRALLTHIAKNLVIDHWRRREVERAFLDTLAQLPEPTLPSLEAQALVLETLQRIDMMLRGLPRQTREMFLMAQIDGLTYQQIADQKRTSLITVKRHMRKAFVACMAAL